MFNYICKLQYNGRNFSGWGKQKHSRTIQGTIEKAIKLVTKNDNFKTLGASKTDAGVHAIGQKMLLVIDFEPNIESFLKAVNSNLFPDINIAYMKKVSKDFSIRNCKLKRYQYAINTGEFDIFHNDFEYYLKRKIDLNRLEESLNLFKGEHNFLNFSGLNDVESREIRTIREITKIDLIIFSKKIKIIFEAKSFIRYQIRRIVGACIAYATGQILEISTLRNVLELKSDKLKYIADPKGLTLEKIWY